MPTRVNLLATIVSATLLLACLSASAAKDDIEKFGSWFYQCQTAKVGKICALKHVQLFNDKSHALTLAIFDSVTSDKIHMHFKVPLGVYLPDGIHISIDSRKPHIAKYLDCNKPGCTGVIEYKKDGIHALKIGKKMRVEFTYQKGKKKIGLNVPLNGINAGISKVLRPKKAAQKEAEQDGSGGVSHWFNSLFSSELDSPESE